MIATDTAIPNDSCNLTDRAMTSSEHGDGTRAASSGRAGASRAARLLQTLIRRELATVDALSCFLGISRPQLLQYVVGKTRMPLESQRRLADLIGNEVPELAIEANRLRLQCNAEERFRAGETKTHMVAPAHRFR